MSKEGFEKSEEQCCRKIKTYYLINFSIKTNLQNKSDKRLKCIALFAHNDG